eukprot:232647_1
MKRKRNDEEPADNSSTTDHFRQVHNRAAADERARARRLRLDALASEARTREARLVKVRARTSQVQEANDAELARKLAEQWEEEDRQRTTNLLESDSQFAKQCDATLKAVLLSTAGSGPNKENIANSAANNNEMGLGMTIQSIGLMTARPSPDRARRTTLIIGPLALVRQWADEIASFTQPALTTYIYHGQNRIKDPRKLVKFDVVITSYSIIAAEYPKRLPGTAQKLGPILKTKFYRIILDECQEIKNRATRSSQGCAQLLGKFRWCLSGTPIQNSLDDVFSLFRFLKLPHWSAWKNFKVLSAGVKGNRPAAAWVRVRNVMRSVMLRRTKSQVDIRLPSREINLVELKMSDEEMDIYKSIETKAQTKFSKYFQEGSVRRNYMNVLKMLNDLRQACNHPWLNVDFKRTFAQLSSPFDPSAAVSSSSSSSSSCSSSSSSAVVVSPARPNIVPNASHLELLVEMGFGQNQSSHALVAVENQSLDLAIDWL